MGKQDKEPKYDYLPSGDYDIYYYYGTDIGFMVCYLFLKLREAAWAGIPPVSERRQIRWLESCFIILPITKNSTSLVVPINDTLHRILSEMSQKSGYVFGNGNGGHVRDIKHSFTSA
jgi:hypothetical protein